MYSTRNIDRTHRRHAKTFIEPEAETTTHFLLFGIGSFLADAGGGGRVTDSHSSESGGGRSMMVLGSRRGAVCSGVGGTLGVKLSSALGGAVSRGLGGWACEASAMSESCSSPGTCGVESDGDEDCPASRDMVCTDLSNELPAMRTCA